VPSPDWNALRFDPRARRGHVESYFIKANDPGGERALWIRATIFAPSSDPAGAVAEGWAIAFDRSGGKPVNVAVKHSVPWDASCFGKTLEASWKVAGTEDSMEMGPARARGAISAKGHRIGFDLVFEGSQRPIVPFFSEKMYDAPLPRTKLVTPLPDARFEGEITVDGATWPIAGWRGMQGHNWGAGHAELYAWCHASVWKEDPEFVLEGLSAQVRVGPVLSPLTTLVCVRHRGVAYDFKRPLELLRARGDVSPRSWHFTATADHGRIEGIVEAGTDDMVGLYYPNPAGPMTYCLNSKLASARVRFEAKGRPPLDLTSRAAALEIGTRDAEHGVRMHV
jgi:hypothetical protein